MKILKIKDLRQVTFILVFILVFCFCGADASESKELKIRVTIGKTELTATLVNSESSREFVAMFPLRLTLKDYAGTEKISYLAGKLSTKNAPSGCDPSVGDITYYAPWGNLAIFYKDFGYANGLVKLGSFDSGIELLAKQTGDFEATFELIK